MAEKCRYSRESVTPAWIVFLMKKQTLGYETDKKDSLGISVKSARAQNNIDTMFFCLYYMGVAEHIEK